MKTWQAIGIFGLVLGGTFGTGCNRPSSASQSEVQYALDHKLCGLACKESQKYGCYAYTDVRVGVDTAPGQECSIALQKAGEAFAPDCNFTAVDKADCVEITSVAQYKQLISGNRPFSAPPIKDGGAQTTAQTTTQQTTILHTKPETKSEITAQTSETKAQETTPKVETKVETKAQETTQAGDQHQAGHRAPAADDVTE